MTIAILSYTACALLLAGAWFPYLLSDPDWDDRSKQLMMSGVTLMLIIAIVFWPITLIAVYIKKARETT